MRYLLPLSALAVCLAVAVRSTWSPCGLSMLSTITPMGERTRGRRYAATVRWFVAGGLCLGALMAALAAAVRAVGASTTWTAAGALGACVLVAASDLRVLGVGLPVHHRQVNERWLDEFRPWVYGAGFGWQLGTGLATYITTGGVYLLIVLGALGADPLTALELGVLFGMARGLAIAAGRGVAGPEALLALHRRLAVLEPASRRLVVATVLAAAAVLAVPLVPGAERAAGAVLVAAAAAVVLLAAWATATVTAMARGLTPAEA
ncbi:MAG TPA: hypothetical protein VMU09_07670 [Acidimicrobiales bacterium]|nr:hypothetical protein [Acidimicrobiales bacterium]